MKHRHDKSCRGSSTLLYVVVVGTIGLLVTSLVIQSFQHVVGAHKKYVL